MNFCSDPSLTASIFQTINELNGSLSEKTELLAKQRNELEEIQNANTELQTQNDKLADKCHNLIQV